MKHTHEPQDEEKTHDKVMVDAISKHDPKRHKIIGVTAQSFEPVTLTGDGTVQTVKSENEKDSFVRVNAHIDGARYNAAIVLRNNAVTDFVSVDSKTVTEEYAACALEVTAREFRILAFQKKNKDFNFTPIYSDALISKDELKEYL